MLWFSDSVVQSPSYSFVIYTAIFFLAAPRRSVCFSRPLLRSHRPC